MRWAATESFVSISSESLEADEETLIRLAVAGSKEAFAELLRAHQAAVRWCLFRLLRDSTAVDDVAQEVFIEAYQHLNEKRQGGSLRPWLIGICRNKAKEYVRALVRRKNREQGAMVQQLALWRMERLESAEAHCDDFEWTLTALRECLERLAPKSRHLIDEHYFQSQTLEALGKRHGSTGGAMRMLLFRVRKALGECLRKKLPEEV